MIRTITILVSVVILVAVCLWWVLSSAYFLLEVPDAGDVQLMIVYFDGQSHSFNGQEDKKTIRRVLRALKWARRGPMVKLDSRDYILFHLRNGKCVAFGVGSDDDNRITYIVDESNECHNSKKLFGILNDISKSKKNLYKDTSLPKYEIKLFKIHHPGNKAVTLDKGESVFSALTDKVKALTVSMDIADCYPDLEHDEVLPFYHGEGDMEKELTQRGGAELYLREPITISTFAVQCRPGTGMSFNAKHEKFKCQRMVILRYPGLRHYGILALNSMDEPDRFFMFFPRNTTAEEAAYSKKTWGEILDILDGIGKE